jgi:hypothetical protein
VPVTAPAETLARMARTVSVTAEDLRNAGRSDAAEELERMATAPADEAAARDGDAELDELIEEAKVRRNRGDTALYDTLMAVKRMNEAARQLPQSDADLDGPSQQAG